MEFHERVRQAFLELAAADPDHYLVVDARLPVEVIAAAVGRARRSPSLDTGQESMTRLGRPRRPGARRRGRCRRRVAGRGHDPRLAVHRPARLGRSNAAAPSPPPCSASAAAAASATPATPSLAGTHADVTVVRTEKLSIGVDEVRDLVRRSALAPVGRRWQIMIVEDADRLTEQACNALLKAIEEPTERTVWMLCAPTVDDVVPDDPVPLPRWSPCATPTADDVAAFLVRRDGVADGLAAYAARASQGHIGRARALARDEATRNRRREVVTIPARLTSLGACMTAAANLAEVTKEEADLITSRLDEREKADLDAAYGVVERGRRPREYAPALAALERAQKTRAKRRQLDVVDRGLMDLCRSTATRSPRPPARAGPWSTRRSAATSPRSSAARRPSSTCGGSAGSSRPASRCWSSTSRSPLALESMMLALKVPEGSR